MGDAWVGNCVKYYFTFIFALWILDQRYWCLENKPIKYPCFIKEPKTETLSFKYLWILMNVKKYYQKCKTLKSNYLIFQAAWGAGPKSIVDCQQSVNDCLQLQ